MTFQFRFTFEYANHMATATSEHLPERINFSIRPETPDHRKRFGEELAIWVFWDPTLGYGYSVPATYSQDHDAFMQALFDGLSKVKHDM